MRSKTLVAKLTMTKADGHKRIVEVHVDAGFKNFYKWFRQEGRKRKVFMRWSERNDGIRPHYAAPHTKPGLVVLAAAQQSSFKEIVGIKIQVFKKRIYERLLTCAADQLAGELVKIERNASHDPRWVPAGLAPIEILPGGHPSYLSRLAVLAEKS